MSLRSGSRANLKSAGSQRPFVRAESVKSMAQNGMRMVGTAMPGQRRDMRGDQTNKNTAVVTFDDLQRIKEQCALIPQESEMLLRQKEREELKQKSQARVKNWPNTISAMRQKREDEKIKRLYDEEMERRKVDEIETQLQQEKRIQAIESANKKLHDNQDQVKAFHSKMLLCDVIQEREAQKELKVRKENIDKNIEHQWTELEKLQMDEYDIKLAEKLENHHNKRMDTAKVIKQQLYEFKVDHIKKLKNDRLEGKLIRKQVEDNIELERQKEFQRKLQQAKNREELNRANEELRAYQLEIKRKEEIEAARIKEYSRKKDQLEQLRKEKEAQKFQEKQDIKQRLVERQAEHLASIKSRDEEILNKHVAEAEEKAARLFEEKERKRIELQNQIERSRKNQIDKRFNEKEQSKQQEKEFAEFWKIRNEELAIGEQQEKEEIRQRNAELQGYHQRQIDLRTKKAEEDYKKQLEETTKAKALLDQNDKEFYSYAEKCIKEWQDAGKNVTPLILELKNYKKQII
ncbi:UNKNOWN [Stylonychia lemnae]|uniref:Trichohyalin-plectin-homology domain-containing protein n=1 Tax=Stylonychia lemnae TaxID=5949 RepID=A0A077ZRV6_STYLE|nr:UNKNOWN [Stylonychia lemnae]|eukprot:CDW72209.1 UNKNOWN [Stylonychia lemnae]